MNKEQRHPNHIKGEWLAKVDQLQSVLQSSGYFRAFPTGLPWILDYPYNTLDYCAIICGVTVICALIST